MKSILTKSCFVVVLALTSIGCNKEEPIDCLNEQPCLASSFHSGDENKVVGRWQFIYQEWRSGYGQNTWEWTMDTSDYGYQYFVEISEEGILSLYKNDSLLDNHKLSIDNFYYLDFMDFLLTMNKDCDESFPFYLINDSVCKISGHPVAQWDEYGDKALRGHFIKVE